MKVSNKDMKYINMAYNECDNSTMLMKHGCVITCNNKYISKGYNSKRNKFNDNIIPSCCSCHAEMDALRKAIKVKCNSLSLPVTKKKSCFL
jgi:deoxycytidylate deaminase